MLYSTVVSGYEDIYDHLGQVHHKIYDFYIARHEKLFPIVIENIKNKKYIDCLKLQSQDILKYIRFEGLYKQDLIHDMQKIKPNYNVKQIEDLIERARLTTNEGRSNYLPVRVLDLLILLDKFIMK